MTKYVGRYDAGSGYMEWAGGPVGSIEEAKSQVKGIGWTDVDVVEGAQPAVVKNGKMIEPSREGKVVATGILGQGWVEAG